MAAPELRLNVSLDLGFFRQQLRQLSAVASSEFNAPLKVKFDRASLNKEIQALNRYVNNKTFNIKINTNLEAEIKAADRLVQALQRVQKASGNARGGLPLGTKGLSRTAYQGGFSAAEIKALFNASIQGGLLDEKTLGRTRSQMVAALGTIGRDSIKGLLDGLESGDARLQQAAQSLGKSLIASFKDVLGIASPSKEFRKIGDDAGKGFEQGLLRAMEIAEQSATRQMQRMLDRLARMALMMGGMSASQISRQIQGMKAPPSLNWPATAPSRSVSIGPSSTGRMLPPGYTPPGLPGTAIGSQKLLMGDILDPALKNAARDAANAFVDTIRKSLNEAVRSVNVRDLGNALRPALSGSQVAGFLAPGVGRVSNPYATGRLGRDGETRAELFARREREARMRSALRGVDVMGEGGMASRAASPYSYAYRGARPQGAIVPYAPGGAMVYRGPGGGGMPPGGGTGGGPGNFAGRGGGPGGGFNIPNLPGAGLVREIGQEFGFATKQVLLFGTAYKALAFIQGFPGQVGAAVGALQSFRNTLNAISPTAKDAAASNKLILDTVNKYNIPIQSARDGFTKLYASMKPAGFSGKQIGDLFLGISKVSATLGLSREKVDRVTYAFSQMASKGQLMAEEVSGQLGDVIPGALSIMAEAANMDIKTFKKAMEDGVFVGQAFEAVMSNVPIVLEKRFGKGAEGAAKTFQGAINNMQTSLTLLYEAFEPVAVGFLNAVVRPMTDGLQTITDGFNSFFTGQAAQTAGGSAFAKQLNDLKPAFEGILANIQALVPSFQIFGNLLLNAGKLLASLAGNPITGFLLKVYTNILLVNTAFTLLGGKILLSAIASINATIARMVAMTVTMNALGVATTRAGTSIAGTQLQMALLQSSAAGAVGPVTTLLGSLLRLAAIGAIAIIVTIAISGANELRDAELRLARLRGEKDPVGPEGPKPVLTPSRRFVGATRETVQAAREKQAPLLLQYRKELKVLQQQALTAKAIADTSEDNAQASVANTKARAAQARVEAKLIDIQNAQGILNLDPGRYPTAAERQSASVKAMTNIAGGDGGAAGGGTKLDTYDRSKLDFIQQQAEQEQLALDRRRQQNIISETRYKIDSAALALDTAKLEEAEKLRLATMATNKDNLSAQDKQLKLADLQIAYTNNLAIAQDKYNVAVEGAKKELEGPFNDAIDNANFSIMEQQMLLENIQNGVKELTPDQQAYLEVLRLTTGKSEDELKILAGKSNTLRQILEQQIAINKQVKIEQKLRALRDEIKLLRIIGDEERRIQEIMEEENIDRFKAQEIFNLEKIKKNIEDTRALIGDFVSSTSSDYKGFLKAVISGEDAADALKQFQEGLKDRVLTIFLDFAMAPVEKFMKEAFEKLFRVDRASEIEKLPGTDIDKATETDPVAATNDNTNATRLSTKATENLTTAISNLGGTMVPGTNVPATGFTSPGIEQFFGGGLDFGVQALDLGKFLGDLDLETAFEPLQKNFSATLENLSSTLDANAFSLKDSATDYSESFDSVGGSANKIAEDAGKAAKEAEKNGKDFEASLNYVAGGIAIAGTTIMGIGAGINQMKKGGTGNTLMGIGSILASLGGGIGGFTKLFAANGGVADGGWKPFPVSAFANGGMVSGPTLGLVGEGKYNEAIVPLPDGRSIPVQMQGESIRDKMGGGAAGAMASPMLSMSFQSTTINGVEYVDRAQLEAAMAETRRMASKEGATRGANLALDKLANSPSSRRRVGIR